MNQNFRQQARQKLVNHSNIYSLARTTYRAYCKSMGAFHVLPDFLIIGAARSGTTSLYEYLMQHPCVDPPVGKEVYFFDKKFKMGIKWYRSFFPSIFSKFFSEKISKRKILTGEATPRYLYHPHTPSRVFNILPYVKLIVLLRNPVDRAFSHYQMEVDHGDESLSFEEATNQEESRIKEEMEKMQKDENYYSVFFYRKSYLTRGIYLDQLKRWFQFFPRKQFLILKSEDFYSKTSEVYNQALSFLNLPKFSLQNYDQYKKRQYSAINSETRKKLIEYFRPHNEQLYELLGTNFHWEDE